LENYGGAYIQEIDRIHVSENANIVAIVGHISTYNTNGILLAHNPSSV
jgi:hypothetical protein